ncbi:NADP-dependent aldehyde dehydrogenase [Chryseobacterium bernardetii]|uniref:NADP-dependent aldehyde dehydrogenase n=2 Tax=Chryseobacterium TaxID=59732 RepID=A0A543EJ66_9FLAO|nr:MULTISPECIES: aldehyde dehydrogenase (NADP(+)) [Chryseobacterium]MDR6370062.1 NADP-dependent aldehyde dehydrogenase [Chryseobacterium vietnamense]MDR6440695.1 NADP-dependent aldehyde dehydrogenase [Chryseobacterium bernardetii]TQM21624.1 NADP-dependent aldehyde dehydrogenase [Chryseobacterium aquifrigidense]
MIEETSPQNIDRRIQMAVEAFRFLKNTTIHERAEFMNAVADQIEALGEELLTAAHSETSLPLARLTGEKARTTGQWRSYAKAVAAGIYTEARIDLPQPEKQKGDIRKYNVGIGPVVIFGASNFPFAFSTAGGDTASAIGAGCPVIIKAHPAHPQTSQIMADAIATVVSAFGWPEGIFSHITGTSYEIGAYLTQHPDIRAIAFTGSFNGGKALFDIASRRENPVPVFAEMGSINPVFAFQQLLETKAETLAKEYSTSLTLGVGQFCTNPGVLIALRGKPLDRFINTLKDEIQKIAPANMLHKGIFENFEKNKNIALKQPDVEIIASGHTEAEGIVGNASVIKTNAETFLNNPVLSEEVFGPFGIVVVCETEEELMEIARQLKGQLTITIAATNEDVRDNSTLINVLKDKCGRLLFNGMPTGVEVVYGMQHGGPFPSTTDSRFTSVGPDAVKRFVRPISFQNWPDEFLPKELKNENPLQINRMVDGTMNSESLKLQTT